MIHNKKIIPYYLTKVIQVLKTKETDHERVILVGCQTDKMTDEHFQYSLEELASLTKTAKGEVVATVTQKRDKIDPATYIGRGKVAELVNLIEETNVELVIFNDELTASQVRNLLKHVGGKEIRIIDRTQLILDIFAQRAQTKEGKLQVELAQLQYLLPRLHGQGQALSRLGGGIGTRGPGETQLETDRRHIRRRMDEIKKQLQTIVEHRKRYRERRKSNQTLQIALVGYTNAGKSTILNRLTEAGTLEEDLLFATLDPTTRKLKLPSGLVVLLTDTVGFIQDLPTTLVAAFRSTLEEVLEADLLLHILDAANPNVAEHEKTVHQLLEELKATNIPMMTIYNKIDRLPNQTEWIQPKNSLAISAYDDGDLQRLLVEIEKKLMEMMEYYSVYIKSSEGKLLSDCKVHTIVKEQKWLEDLAVYELRGYVHPNQPLASILRKRIKGE